MPGVALSRWRDYLAQNASVQWSNWLENSLGNLGGCSTPDQLAAIVRNRLKRIQCRPTLIDGFLAQTGLSLEPEPP
jgi:putative transposase